MGHLVYVGKACHAKFPSSTLYATNPTGQEHSLALLLAVVPGMCCFACACDLVLGPIWCVNLCTPYRLGNYVDYMMTGT